MSSQGQSPILLKGETATAVREGSVSYVDGKPIKRNITSFQFRGSFQPLGGRELMMVPEADRTKEQYWIYTTARLALNDRVERCGVNYQVQTVESWGNHSKVRAMRIDVGPNATP